jgi:hypothetical protein
MLEDERGEGWSFLLTGGREEGEEWEVFWGKTFDTPFLPSVRRAPILQKLRSSKNSHPPKPIV